MKANLSFWKTDNSIYLAIGCFWGFTEFFVGTTLKNHLQNNVIGSILIGLSLFFLSSGYNYRKKILSIIVPATICILLKLVGTLLTGQSIFHPKVTNPIASILLETIVFILFYFLIMEKKTATFSREVITGALCALTVSLIFPVIQHLTCTSICIKEGTNLPLSVYYLPIAVIVGAFALPTGFYFNSKITYFSLKLKNYPINLSLNIISLILVVISICILYT